CLAGVVVHAPRRALACERRRSRICHRNGGTARALRPGHHARTRRGHRRTSAPGESAWRGHARRGNVARAQGTGGGLPISPGPGPLNSRVTWACLAQEYELKTCPAACCSPKVIQMFARRFAWYSTECHDLHWLARARTSTSCCEIQRCFSRR